MKEKIFDKRTFLGGWYISTDLCDDMIKYFKSNKKKQNVGKVGMQKIDTSIKDSIDLQCTHTDTYPLAEYRTTSKKRFNFNLAYRFYSYT